VDIVLGNVNGVLGADGKAQPLNAKLGLKGSFGAFI